MNPDPKDTLMVEGDEPPPRGVHLMAAVRWILLGLAATVAVFAWWSYARAELHGQAGSEQASAKYHCPMHPQIVSNEPGECPICHMNLEPVASNRTVAGPSAPSDAGAPMPAALASVHANTSPRNAGASSPAPSPSAAQPPGAPPGAHPGTAPPGTTPITLTLDRIQSIGVRTAVVGEATIAHKLRATAVVAPTEQGTAEIHVRSPGFVERILVNQTGTAVHRDQALFELYSPEILQAQNELLVSQQWTGGPSGTTADASRRKLELLGMASKDIDVVATTRKPTRAIPIYAPQAGRVTKKTLVTGSYVTPEMALYEIQDFSRVYVLADVFQRDIGAVQIGTPGRFVPARRSDLAVDARVDLLYPTLNAEARTTRVRMQIQNQKGATFRPGEYGTVEFEAPAHASVTVPLDAVIDTGLHTYVFVVQGEGVFSPREVVLGDEQGEMVTVLEGVSPGERVVSGATFLIDSESRLQASAVQAAMTAPREPSPTHPGEAPSCQEIDRTKFPEKWTECQKCTQVHHGMGTMEADCKNAIPKPWK
jgi:Cu(I)/Ag(I) efflux system membrane fusion protein